jgi:hypothetical protein
VTTSLRADLRRGIFMGVPVGYATGLALYGGIGYWIAGSTGLLVGCAIATSFAAIGLHLCLRSWSRHPLALPFTPRLDLIRVGALLNHAQPAHHVLVLLRLVRKRIPRARRTRAHSRRRA